MKKNDFCYTKVYAAPEIFKYGLYNQKSDVWSLGVILYQMLTEADPWNKSDGPEMIQKIKRGEYCKQMLHHEEVSDQAIAFIDKLLTVVVK